MSNETGVIIQTQPLSARASTLQTWPALCAALLGATLLFTAGFADIKPLHSAAHDARHAAGFPCH